MVVVSLDIMQQSYAHAFHPTGREACRIGAGVEKTDLSAPVRACSQDEPTGYWQGPCEYLVQRSGIRRRYRLQRGVRSALDNESETCPALHNPSARKDPFPE